METLFYRGSWFFRLDDFGNFFGSETTPYLS